MPIPADCTPAVAAQAQEARLLVALLRSARLSLLFGEAGSHTSAFLQDSLLPLLQRRLDDRPPAQPAHTPQGTGGVVVPFPDRRKRQGTRPAREVVVVFDDWDGVPLATLLTRLRQAARPADPGLPLAPGSLVESLHALGARDGVNFIIVLDRFEAFLRLPAQREGVAEFTDELVQALTTAQLPANFLLALDNEACSALDALRRRIPGFDDYSLRLPSVATPAPEPAPVTAPVAAVSPISPPQMPKARHATAAPSPIKPPTPLRAPVKTQDVYALIEATLNRTTADNDCEPFQGSGPGALTPLPAEPAASSVPPLARQPASWRPAEPSPESAAPAHLTPMPVPSAEPAEPAASPTPDDPTLIERCKSLATRLWHRPHEPD